MAKPQKRFRVKVEITGKTIVETFIPVLARTEDDAYRKIDKMSNKRLMVKANRQLGRKRLWSVEECCFI
jgi:hypothetical protein